MKDARVGRGVDGVKNANPSSESASKMRTFRQKADVEHARMATFSSKSASKMRTFRQKIDIEMKEGERKVGRGPTFWCLGKATGDTCRIDDFQ